MNSKISYKVLYNYLKNPLKTKSELIFGSNFDMEEKLENEYEDLSLDKLSLSKVNKIVAKEVLTDPDKFLDANGNIKLENIQNIKNKCTLFNILPRSNDSYKSDSILDASFNKSIRSISDLFILYNNIFNENVKKDAVLKMDTVITIDNHQIIVKFDDVLFNKNNNDLYFIEIKKTNTDNNNVDFYYLYIISLIYVFINGNSYNIHLFKNINIKREYFLNQEIAYTKLRKIISKIFDNEYKFIAVSQLDKKYENSFELINEALQGGTWKYFNDKYLFNTITKLGYQDNNIKKDYSDAIEDYLSLVDLLINPDKKCKKKGTK